MGPLRDRDSILHYIMTGRDARRARTPKVKMGAGRFEPHLSAGIVGRTNRRSSLIRLGTPMSCTQTSPPTLYQIAQKRLFVTAIIFFANATDDALVEASADLA